jgi:hypothetical protein
VLQGLLLRCCRLRCRGPRGLLLPARPKVGGFRCAPGESAPQGFEFQSKNQGRGLQREPQGHAWTNDEGRIDGLDPSQGRTPTRGSRRDFGPALRSSATFPDLRR